ncbi:MAG: uroporphyrinogen decarboxylase family protein [Armatimonadetes bacterium]|nr:uroporphyrinogen decarboxylase family protein [Armatimonadota bacterium]
MTSIERVLTTLGHNEPDRVPLFLLLSMHGAKELGLSIRDYFARPEHVVEGQLRLRERYGHDCYYLFHHAPLEAQAWGGEVVFVEDGPPNSGEPPLTRAEQIDHLELPVVADCAALTGVLAATSALKSRAGDEVPLIGVVMSPFSLPVMQLGFELYLQVLLEQPERFARLMALNEAFCVEWANAQLRAGATAICYFDPVASPTIVPPTTYRALGQPVARHTLSRIEGPTATHLASGRALPIVDDLASTGTAIIGVGHDEPLAALKAAAHGKVSLLGNLNGVAMCRWTGEQAEAEVKRAIGAAGPGGGFILAEGHGEVPWQVTDDTLLAVADAARRWGAYPLSWVGDHGP